MRRALSILLVVPLLTGCQFLAMSRHGGPDLQHGNEPTIEARKSTYDKLPDTTKGHAVHAFSDQPAQSNPLDKTVRFAATHFAGTQKMTSEQKARFVDINPNWVQLHYRLGVASGPAQYIHDDKWDSDWHEVNSHNDWFLRNGSGARSQTTVANGSWALHDLSNPDFRAYWLANVSDDIKATASDAVFADSFMGGVGCALLDTGKCDARLQGTGAGDITKWANGHTWLNQLDDWGDAIQTALHELPGRPLFLPNLDALNTFWAVSKMRLNNLDGAFLENFPLANQNTDFISANTNALVLTASDKFVIMQDSVDPANANQRSFVVGTYLLLKGKRTFLNMMGGTGDTGFYYWPEYEIDLGEPLSPPPADFASYRWGTVYRRDFQKGMVLVNGASGSATFSVPQNATYYQVLPSGGGAISELQIDAEGGISGQSLAYNAVSGTVSVPAYASVILVTSHP